MGTSILKAAEISLFCLERGQMDEKQMFPLGEECSSSCKFLQERGGLVDQLHLLHDCLVGTHTHTHMHSHTHLCPHPHMDVPAHVYTQTHTVRHGNRSF